MSRAGAYAGLIVGGVTVIVWMQLKDLGGVFALYEIVPGMLASTIAIVAASLAFPQRRG
jgi:sodium/proline symporter